MLLTDAQIWQIRELIQLHHAAFVVNNISPQAVAPQILERLKATGMVDLQVNSIQDAYLYGQLLSQLDNPAVQGMSWQQFQAFVKKNPLPLSPIEQRSVAMAQQRAGQHVVGLGNKVDTQTGELLIEADDQLRAQLQTTIRDKTAENIARRESVKKLKSDLGWATSDWARDWDRIAITEKHSAMQAGVRDSIRGQHGGGALVAKVPLPGACRHCQRLFLDSNGLPIVFRLDALEANGHNNVGRKAADWKPVIGPMHPHCSCQLVRIPAGWGFDETGALVPGGEVGEVQTEDDLERALRLEHDLHKANLRKANLRKVTYQGIPIRVENEPGSIREGDSADGEHWRTHMLYAYGYIERTDGADGEEVDVFLGPDAQAKMAYVIHQEDPDSGMSDEDKVMLGFPNERAARAAYAVHYDRPMGYTLSRMTVEHFKRWVSSGQLPPRLVAKSITGTRISTEEGAAHSPIGRRSPSPGTSPNFIFRVPQRRIPSPNQRMRELLDDASKPEPIPENLKRDKEEYEYDEELGDWVRPADRYEKEATRDKQAIEANRTIVDGELERRKETAELQNKSPRKVAKLKKAGPYIGPRGGKWADPEHKIPWDAGKTHTVYRDTSSKKRQASGMILEPKLAEIMQRTGGGKVKIPAQSGAHAMQVSDLAGIPVDPLSDENKQRIREAHKEGIKLPPIELAINARGKVQLVDGHHRLAMARELGHITIDTVWHFEKSLEKAGQLLAKVAAAL